MAMRDLMPGYRVPDLPTRSLQVERISGRSIPGEPLELTARSANNTVSVPVALRAEAVEANAGGAVWAINGALTNLERITAGTPHYILRLSIG
jgi:hypothetical protein